jgi:transposase
LRSIKDIEALFKQVENLTSHVGHLENEIKDLKRENEMLKDLKRENELLKERLSKYENPKNSNNSSIPPSKDENRPFKSKSLRKKTGRKPGGQKGHEGTTLEMVSDPNEIINHSQGILCLNDLSRFFCGG